MKEPRLVAAALLLAALVISTDAAAAVRRFAVVIGHNRGDVDEAELRFAERDASRLADVLVRLGGVPPENLVTLLSPDADGVQRVLESVNQRIAAETAAGDESLLFVYYSGHADAFAMHLGGTQLRFDAVKGTLQRSEAEVRVLVIDACRSGGVTRVKGMDPAEPFQIDVEDKLSGEGLAIITSAASGEDAQESERLQGSFFTHHLIAAMLGAADATGDRRVTLSEAYDYAYVETLRSTSSTPVVQHPTYAFAMKGRKDLVLTDLNQHQRGLGRLLLGAGSYVVFERSADGPVVAEVKLEDDGEVAIGPGVYAVRLRGPSAVYEAQVTVVEGETTALRRDGMRQVPYAALVRKGGAGAEPLAWGVLVSGGATGAVVPGLSAQGLGSVGLHVDLEALALGVTGRYAISSHENSYVALEQQTWGLSLSAWKLFDISVLTLGLGVVGGGDWASQALTSPGEAPDRGGWIGHGGVMAWVGVTPLPWLSVVLQAGGEAFFAEVSSGGEASWQATLAPVGTLGVMIGLE